MSQNPLEKTLNLPSLQEALDQINASSADKEQEELEEAEKELNELKESDPETAETFMSALSKTQELERKLADHSGLNQHDIEMNDIIKTSKEHYAELYDYGMNCAPAQAGRIFENAIQMLKLSLDASNSKADKKLKSWRLQLEQARLLRDLEQNKEQHDPKLLDNEDVVVSDRNQMYAQLTAKDAEISDKDT